MEEAKVLEEMKRLAGTQTERNFRLDRFLTVCQPGCISSPAVSLL